jgi:hypothetical protein
MTSLAKIMIAAAMTAVAVGNLPMSASANDTGVFLGGLAVGALAGAAIAGGNSGPVYVAPSNGPVYGPPVYYQRRCWLEAEPIFDAAGYQVGHQTVRHCR